MLSRSHRFHGYGSLRRAYSQGQTVRGSLLSLRYASRPATKPYRVAVVVSKKVNKSAVIRNRIRRRVYESVRHFENVPQNTDLIFTVFSDQLVNTEDIKLKSQVSELLEKAAIQQKKSA